MQISHIIVAIAILLIPTFYTLHHILNVLIDVKSRVLLSFSKIKIGSC